MIGWKKYFNKKGLQTESSNIKTLMEKIIKWAKVRLSHLARTALLRHVAQVSSMPKRVTTTAPPHVNGPQGCNLQTGEAQSSNKGPPSRDKGEKASSVQWKAFSTLRSVNLKDHQYTSPLTAKCKTTFYCLESHSASNDIQSRYRGQNIFTVFLKLFAQSLLEVFRVLFGSGI